MKIRIILCAGLMSLGVASTAYAANVIVGDKEWRQLTETVGISWNQAATVCPTDGGVCSGSIDATDFTGWIWASVAEVGTLFQDLTPHPGGVNVFNAPDHLSAWATNFFDVSGFQPTDTSSVERTASGITTSLFFTSFARVGTLFDRFNAPDKDVVTTLTVKGIAVADSAGIWLYRPTLVPLPPALPLMGLAVAGLGFMRRRKTA